MILVKVFVQSKSAHCSQLFCGLDLMQRENIIKLEYYLGKDVPVLDTVVRLQVDKKIVYIDLKDSNKIDLNLYQRCDFYFKRMLLKSDAEKYEKIHPYGLNYSAMTKNNFLQYLFIKDKNYLKNSLKYHKIVGKIFNINDSIQNCNYKNFERKPSYHIKDKIVFSTRLWDPARNSEEWKKKERNVLNTQRISLVKKMKAKYKSTFEGGILSDYYSDKLCPNEIVSSVFSQKKEYLKLLKEASICVANQGLEDSIGWKFSEYIANSSAILTTPIDKYLLLGDLKENEHYLTFTSESEFMDKLDSILNDRKKRNLLMKNNHRYYEEYLHPLAKMKRIINQIVNTDKI